MNKELKLFNVAIFGTEYTITSDESYESVAELASIVDGTMREIAQKTQAKDPTFLAVLAALKLSHGFRQCKNYADLVEFEKNGLEKQIDQALSMFDSLCNNK